MFLTVCYTHLRSENRRPMNKKIVNVNVRCVSELSLDENINVFYPVCWAQYLRIIPMVNFCSKKTRQER